MSNAPVRHILHHFSTSLCQRNKSSYSANHLIINLLPAKVLEANHWCPPLEGTTRESVNEHNYFAFAFEPMAIINECGLRSSARSGQDRTVWEVLNRMMYLHIAKTRHYILTTCAFLACICSTIPIMDGPFHTSIGNQQEWGRCRINC